MKSRILRNTSSLMVFNIAKILFPFITLPYLTRVLTTDTYGTVAYIKTVMNYMQIFVDFGFFLSGTKAVVEARDNQKKLAYVIGDTLLARILLGIGAFIFLCIFILLLPILRENAVYTVLAYIAVFESVFLMDFLFRGLEIMHVITIRFILMKVISTLLTFIFVKGDSDLLLIPLFDILGSFVAVLLVFYEMKKWHVEMKTNGIGKAIRSICDSLVYFLSNVASVSFNAFSTLLIGIQLSGTEVAYWSVCMQITGSIQACYTPISDGIYPEMLKKQDFTIVKKALRYIMPIVAAGCIIAYVLADFGMWILGGEDYAPAARIFRMVIPIMFLGFPAVLFGWPTLGAIGREKEVTFSTVTTILVNIFCLLLLIGIDAFTLSNIAILRSCTELLLLTLRGGFFWKYRKGFARSK